MIENIRFHSYVQFKVKPMPNRCNLFKFFQTKGVYTKGDTQNVETEL